MTISRFSTCDLCDAHEGDTSGAFRVLPPVFHDFGVVAPFCGAVHTLRAWEDNSRVREAVNILDKRRVDFEYDGEMGADVALSREAMALYPFCRLTGPANVLVMPAAHST